MTPAEGSYELMKALARGVPFKVSPQSAPKLIELLERATSELGKKATVVFVVSSDPSKGAEIKTDGDPSLN